MPRFSSIAAFVEFLATRPAAVEQAQRKGMEAAGKMLVRECQAMIGEEIREWPALAQSTVEEKQRLGFTGRVSPTDPLLRTGQLRNSISSQVETGKLVLGSDDPVAPFQEYGTSRIPPRSFIGATMFRDGREAADLIGNYVMGAAAGRSGPLVPVQRRDGDEG